MLINVNVKYEQKFLFYGFVTCQTIETEAMKNVRSESVCFDLKLLQEFYFLSVLDFLQKIIRFGKYL